MLREDAVKKRRSAMKEAAMSLSKEAAMNAEFRSSTRRTGCEGARRGPRLTERSQQCQGGLGACKHDLHGHGEDRPSDAGERDAWQAEQRRGACGQHRPGTDFIKASESESGLIVLSLVPEGHAATEA